jgi:AraC-like DNA-binding protein
MRHSIPAKSVVKILDAASRRGVRPPLACAAADIDLAALADPDHRLPFGRVVRLYDACARLTGDETFGLHVGESSHPAMFDVVGYLMMNSPTVGEALRRLERYQRVWTDGSVLRPSVDGAHAQIEYTYNIPDPGAEGRRQDCEATLAIVTAGLRALVGSDWQPDVVWCEHENPPNTSEHARVFRCPIAFSQTTNVLIFKSSVLTQRIPQADPALSAVLDRHAQSLLESLPAERRLADRVREVIVPALQSGDPDLATVARALGMSRRTLQRRLQDEGTSVHDLIDDVRRDLATRYLQQPDLTIADVAYLLGFAEPSTFHRAFRKWTGTTPGEYKRKAR